jgi:hypothetical protein
VFFTTAMASGAARMKFGQFVVWNRITTLAFVLSLGPASYGAGKVAGGHHDWFSVGMLVLGLAVRRWPLATHVGNAAIGPPRPPRNPAGGAVRLNGPSCRSADLLDQCGNELRRVEGAPARDDVESLAGRETGHAS